MIYESRNLNKLLNLYWIFVRPFRIISILEEMDDVLNVTNALNTAADVLICQFGDHRCKFGEWHDQTYWLIYEVG